MNLDRKTLLIAGLLLVGAFVAVNLYQKSKSSGSYGGRLPYAGLQPMPAEPSLPDEAGYHEWKYMLERNGNMPATPAHVNDLYPTHPSAVDVGYNVTNTHYDCPCVKDGICACKFGKMCECNKAGRPCGCMVQYRKFSDGHGYAMPFVTQKIWGDN
jgi:hypothetical protein